MTVVRISNLPAQVTEDDMVELVSMVDRPKDIRFWFVDDNHLVCEVRTTSAPLSGSSLQTSSPAWRGMRNRVLRQVAF